jgi:hypothetical protein
MPLGPYACHCDYRSMQPSVFIIYVQIFYVHPFVLSINVVFYSRRMHCYGIVVIACMQLAQRVNVSELKYYFTVDTNYVVNKIKLLLFPFTTKVC